MSGLLTILIVLTLAAHLICMNVCSAGPLVSIWLERRFQRTNDPIAGELGLRLTRSVLATFFVGIALGFVLAGLLWLSGNRDFFDALPAFSHKIWWGIWELLTYLIAMCLYWWLWPTANVSRKRTYFHRFLALFSATNLLYHFPPLFTAIANHRPSVPDVALTPAEFRQIVFRHEVISISAHFWLASFAVTGIALMFLGRRAAFSESAIKWPVTYGARIALFVTALQFVVGLWVTVKLPAHSQQMVTGGNWIATSCFGASVLLSFGLLNRLSAIAFGEFDESKVRFAVVNVVTIVVLMSATLYFAQN